MLGQTRRTTRTDVSLALSAAGFVFLAWVLACWSAKQAAMAIGSADTPLPGLTRGFMATFGGAGRHAFDIVGPLWMFFSLWRVIRAAHQRRIISWSWLLTGIQAIGAILIASWASLAQAHATLVSAEEIEYMPDWFCAVIIVAVAIWLATLYLLVSERSRLKRKSVLSVSAKTQSFR
jgi:peptidoglycan biosynthesis protein MviN/MurJ (putative lipid II flippase)